MSGTQYIALSGLRARMDELDRLAGDLANIGTAGYKGERESRVAAERPAFDQALQTAIDTTTGARRLDTAEGAFTPTGRALDAAIDGGGFFVLATKHGERYTRNGNFKLDEERRLTAPDGSLVQGEDGPITVGEGEVRFDSDGTVWSGATKAGRLKVVEFAHPERLERESGTRLRTNGQDADPSTKSVIKSGVLEQSNVSVADRLAQLTTVSRGFEALQRSISMVLNEVDGRAIDSLGRRP